MKSQLSNFQTFENFVIGASLEFGNCKLKIANV